MLNQNTYTKLLAKNEAKLNKIKSMYNRIKAIYNLLQKDVLPETATQRFKDVRKKQISECKSLISKHDKFRDAEKTQRSIDNIYNEMVDLLKPYSKIGI
jgi:hypothetical protein